MQTRQQKRQSRSWKSRPKPANDSEWEFEVPNVSPEGVCVQFICENNHFPWWTKVLKLRYWLHFGQKEGSGCYVKWRDTKNDARVATQHLIRVYSTSDDGKVSLFTLNVYMLKMKIMVQSSHKDLWLKQEFSLLKKLVDEAVQGKNLSESYLLMTGVAVTVGSNDDLVPSDNEEDSDLDDKFDDVISDSDKDEDNDVIVNLKTPQKKLKTPIRKRKKTPMKPVNASKKKSTTQGKKDPESKVIELRLRNMEEVTSQINSQLASAESVSQENLIGEIVKKKLKRD